MTIVAITSGTTWTVPAGVTAATIECIGGGSLGGGAYSKTNSVTLTPLSTVYINIGAGGVFEFSGANAGGDTWFNKTTNSAPSTTTNGALAKGGGAAINGDIDGYGPCYGGLASAGVGDLKYSGGSGYSRLQYCCGGYVVFYSSGGAAGPNGNGGNGYQNNNLFGSGGGGANGGSAATNRNGGNNRLGTGGGTGGASPTNGTNGGGGGGSSTDNAGGAGSADLIWTATAGGSYGPAGGGGGYGAAGLCGIPSPVAGVNYGGGGAPGGKGLIIITYPPLSSGSTSNMLMMFI
jgi:hypothetical protein